MCSMMLSGMLEMSSNAPAVPLGRNALSVNQHKSRASVEAANIDARPVCRVGARLTAQHGILCWTPSKHLRQRPQKILGSGHPRALDLGEGRVESSAPPTTAACHSHPTPKSTPAPVRRHHQTHVLDEFSDDATAVRTMRASSVSRRSVRSFTKSNTRFVPLSMDFRAVEASRSPITARVFIPPEDVENRTAPADQTGD